MNYGSEGVDAVYFSGGERAREGSGLHRRIQHYQDFFRAGGAHISEGIGVFPGIDERNTAIDRYALYGGLDFRRGWLSPYRCAYADAMGRFRERGLQRRVRGAA